MLISKILNNNVVITLNDENEEIIVMGRGIGYQKSKGDLIDSEKVNKIFRISNEDTSNKLQELLNNIPIEHMKISNEIIEYAESTLGKKLNDNIYISISDHSYTAINRMKKGITIKNAVLWETKNLYKDEFAIGVKALDIIEKNYGVRLPDDEAGFIALHIVSAQLDNGHTIVHDITKIMQDILNIVRYQFAIEFKESSVFYYRFITHLKFFAQRLLSDSTYKEERDSELLAIIKDKYSEAFQCIKKIEIFIKNQYNYRLTDDEIIYLTIHVAKIVQDSRVKTNQ